MTAETTSRLELPYLVQGWHTSAGNNPLIKSYSKMYGDSDDNEKPKMFEVIPFYKDSKIIPDRNKDIKDPKAIKPQFQYIETPGIPSLILACSPEIEIVTPFRHDNSASNYFAEMEVGNDIFMLSTLGYEELTSWYHYHAKDIPRTLMTKQPIEEGPFPIIEFYKIIHGLAIIHHNEYEPGLAVPTFFSVQPEVSHRMEGGSPNGTVFAIQMKNAALYPPELRHIHLPQDQT